MSSSIADRIRETTRIMQKPPLNWALESEIQAIRSCMEEAR